MAKKKTFEEYTQEALYEIEKTEAALKQAKLEKEQAEHRIQRSLILSILVDTFSSRIFPYAASFNES